MLGALARSAAARRGGVQAVRSFAAAPTSGVEGFTLMNPKNLDDIVKLELLEKEPRENIRRIWETHHDINAGQVGIAMDASVWEAFAANAKQKCASPPRPSLDAFAPCSAMLTFADCLAPSVHFPATNCLSPTDVLSGY